MPTEREAEVREWSQTLTAAIEPTADEEVLAEADVAIGHLGTYLDEVIAERRQHLGDDLLSQLLAVEEAGDRLSHAELRSFVVLLYVAGHETTVNLIGNGVLALLRHPDELRRWRDDPALDATAIDELLRYDGPVQQTVRIPIEPVRYGDVEVAPGTTVMTILGAANHDPAMFEDPDRSASTARTPAGTSPSRPGSTTASAPRWPSSRPPSPSARSSAASPTSPSPASPTGATA